MNMIETVNSTQNQDTLSSNKHLSLLMCKSVTNKTTCKYGDNCRFVHDESEIPEREKLLREKRQEKTRRGRGVCRSFCEKGYCSYGDDCRFAHVTGDEKIAVEKKIEKRKAVKQAREQKYSKEKVIDTQEKNDNGGNNSEEEEDVPNEYESFEQWIAKKVRECSLYSSYQDIFEEGIDIILKWRTRFAERPDIWNRFIKAKAGGNSIRIVKEFCESVPVIDSVRRSIKQMQTEESILKEENKDLSHVRPNKVTILDLCSGFGFLSMFLSEMLPADMVNRIVMIDIQWSRKILQKDIEYGRDVDLDLSENIDDVDSNEKIGLKIENDAEHDKENKSNKDSKGNKYISADHFTGDFYETWPIPLIASKQNIKSRSTLKSMQKVIVERALQEGDLMILGIHLCGILSLRAIDLFNKNASRVRFFALKPCCLPGIFHAKNNEVFSVGQHHFCAKDVCASGKFVAASKNKGGWDGPPRKHLENRFLTWTENLALGVNVPSSSIEFNGFESHLLQNCDDTRKQNTSTDICDPQSYETEVTPNGVAVGEWSKIIEHIDLQESGYQNKYIWVTRHQSSMCIDTNTVSIENEV